MEKMNKPLFPLFTDISDYKIVIVGGGRIACRRIRVLLQFASDLTVVAPEICSELEPFYEQGLITWINRKYEREDLYAAHMVLAATNDKQINDDIHSACKCLGILVNVASDQSKCDFQFPSVIREDALVVGINAAGLDHKKVKETRKKLELCLKGESVYGS